MISSCSKKVIILGEYPLQRREWYSLSNSEVDWFEFSGYKYNSEMKGFDTDGHLLLREGHRPNGDFARVIDSFEYVIRLIPNKLLSYARGLKSNIGSLSNMQKDSIFTRTGLPSNRFDLSNIIDTPDEYNSVEYNSTFLDIGYGHNKELWVTLDGDSNICVKKDSNLNVKFVGSKKYNLIFEMVQDLKIEPNELSDSKWLATSPKLKGLLDDVKEGCSLERTSEYRVSRELQTIFTAITDSRFSGYDIYIDGFFGIDTRNCSYNALLEYKLISFWINEGTIKFFPKWVETERKKYSESVMNFKFNLHDVR